MVYKGIRRKSPLVIIRKRHFYKLPKFRPSSRKVANSELCHLSAVGRFVSRATAYGGILDMRILYSKKEMEIRSFSKAPSVSPRYPFSIIVSHQKDAGINSTAAGFGLTILCHIGKAVSTWRLLKFCSFPRLCVFCVSSKFRHTRHIEDFWRARAHLPQ